MKTYIKISIRVFLVKIRDERTGLTSGDTIFLEKPRLQAAQTVGMDSNELIRRIYSQQGYKVVEIGKPLKTDVSIDLKEIYWNSLGCDEA